MIPTPHECVPETDVDTPTSRYDEPSLEIMKQLSNLETQIKNLSRDVECIRKLGSTDIKSSTSSVPPYLHPSSTVDSHDMSGACPSSRGSSTLGEQPGSALNTPVDFPPSSAILFKASSEMSIEAILRWPIFAKHLACLGMIASPLIEVLGQPSCRTTDFVFNSGREAGVVVDLDATIVTQLIENFLINNHPKNPILDPATLRRDGRLCVETGLGWDGSSCLVVRRRP